MSGDQTIAIIGTGRAGIRAAATLRDEGFAGRVVLISDDSELPYDRVPLSKHFLYHQPGFHALYFHDQAFYTQRDIELRLGDAVAEIALERREVVLESDTRQPYDQLLIATGLAANRWAGLGSDLDGVHYLRSLTDAKRLRDALAVLKQTGGSVAVVGTGWIGCEAAAAAREWGLPVALIGRDALPLVRQVGPEIGTYFRDAHAAHGVTLYLDTEVAALEGTDSVQAVVLADGRRVAANLVLFGIGAAPRTELAAAAGLEIATAEAGGGILTDEYFRTSTADVFAAGDVANVPNAVLGRRTRLAHHAIANAQGRAAARSMLGMGKPYSQLPFFFSDQYEIWMENTGDSLGADDFVVRQYPDGDRFIAFWLRDGRLAAGMNMNIKGVPACIRALIDSGQPVDRAKLIDPNVPLEQVLR